MSKKKNKNSLQYSIKKKIQINNRHGSHGSAKKVYLEHTHLSEQKTMITKTKFNRVLRSFSCTMTDWCIHGICK